MTSATSSTKKRKIIWIVSTIVVVLIIARLLLPYFVLKYVNKEFAALKEYYGHVEDIDIWLIRGAYIIQDIRVWERKNDQTYNLSDIPFLDVRTVDLSVEWSALFKGSVVGEIEASELKLNFVRKKEKDTTDVRQDTADFRQLIRNLMPLKINRFEINNSEIHYIDPLSKPRLDVSMKDIHVLATNLTNANDSAKLLPASLVASGAAYDGTFNLSVNMNPLEKQPTFDLNAELKGLNLVKLNDFLQAYGNVDVKKGTFTVYTEVAAKEGKYKGYVKPLLTDMDMVQWNKEEGSIPQIAWESLVAFFAEILQNQSKERLATKLPLEGSFVTNKGTVGIWDSIWYLLKNAFIKALSPSIDKTIDINAVDKPEEKKNIFKRLFGKEKDEKERNDKKDERKDKK